MADGYLLVGDAAINPDKVLDYAAMAYNDLTDAIIQKAGGAIKFFPPDPEVKPGTDFNAPRLTMIGAATRYDLTSETDATAVQAPDSKQRRMPVLSSVVGPFKWSAQAIAALKKSEGDINVALGKAMALRIWNYRKLRLYDALRGAAAAQAAATPTHTETETDAFDAIDFLDAKKKLGDASQGLVTTIMHSKQWFSLLADVGQTAAINSSQLGDMVFIEGGIPALAGMNIIVDDQVPVIDLTNDQTQCFLLGEGALQIASHPTFPLLTFDEGISIGKVVKCVGEDVFAVGVAGADYDGGQSNPTAAQLYAAANWSPALSHDHREANWAVFVTVEG